MVYQSSDLYDAKTVWRAENSDLKRQLFFEKYTNEDMKNLEREKMKIVKCNRKSPLLNIFSLRSDDNKERKKSEDHSSMEAMSKTKCVDQSKKSYEKSTNNMM